MALINESEHYTYLAGAVTGAGATPLTAADITFSYPAGSFYTAAFGDRPGRASSSCSRSGPTSVPRATSLDPCCRPAVAQITANEAQHLSAFSMPLRTTRPSTTRFLTR